MWSVFDISYHIGGKFDRADVPLFTAGQIW